MGAWGCLAWHKRAPGFSPRRSLCSAGQLRRLITGVMRASPVAIGGWPTARGHTNDPDTVRLPEGAIVALIRVRLQRPPHRGWVSAIACVLRPGLHEGIHKGGRNS